MLRDGFFSNLRCENSGIRPEGYDDFFQKSSIAKGEFLQNQKFLKKTAVNNINFFILRFCAYYPINIY